MRFVDYKCNKCGVISEKVINSDNGCKMKCDKCGSSDMVRVFAPVGLKSSSENDSFPSSSSSGSCSGGSCPTCSGCS